MLNIIFFSAKDLSLKLHQIKIDIYIVAHDESIKKLHLYKHDADYPVKYLRFASFTLKSSQWGFILKLSTLTADDIIRITTLIAALGVGGTVIAYIHSLGH